MSVSVNALSSVGENFEITNNTALTSMSMNALSSVEENSGITNNTALTSVGVPQLQEVGEDFVVQDNGVLSTLLVASCEGNGEGCGSEPPPLTVGGRVDVQAVGESGPVSSVSDLLEAHGHRDGNGDISSH